MMRLCVGESMASLAEIEQVIWAKVWRCNHRHPCRRCCWPWQHWCTPSYASTAPGLTAKTMPAHRMAYIFSRGALILLAPKGSFVVCHQCDFPPCCNPVYLFLGMIGDNLRK